MRVKYSICMCNFNMQDTIEKALLSILEQIDSEFEVVLVDDGSTDESVSIVKKLQHKYQNLHLVQLEREQSRKLGFTRNIGIKNAKGKYVILHLDCDDICGPYLKDFVKVFIRIEDCLKREFLLSGNHIHIAPRDFLIEHGPFVNIYRGEDREFWKRMNLINAHIEINHKRFIQEIPRKKNIILKKTLLNTWDHLVTDFRSGNKLIPFIYQNLFVNVNFSIKLKLYRALIAPFAALYALIMGRYQHSLKYSYFVENEESYKRLHGSYADIMKQLGCNQDLHFINTNNRHIFEDISL